MVLVGGDGLWSDLNFTHLQSLSELPNQVVENLMGRWSNVEIPADRLGDLWIRGCKAPLT